MKTVLVVDDFASVRLYHGRFLAQKGYRCVDASNGADALDTLRREGVDLVLLDLIMPKLGGAAFVAETRAIPQFKHLPIVAITSEARKAETLELERTYGIRILLKPVLPNELLRQVEEALR